MSWNGFGRGAAKKGDTFREVSFGQWQAAFWQCQIWHNLVTVCDGKGALIGFWVDSVAMQTRAISG